jgi:salicylate hydroxylase
MFLGTVGKPEAGFGFRTEQLEELLFLDWSPRTLGFADSFSSHHSVSRITLRQVLLSGLDDTVHLGKEFTRYDRAPSGQVTASFADGTSATGDVLVAADGSNSRVRQQYLPQAQRIDTGVRSIGGKMPLNDETRKTLPEIFYTCMNTIMPPRDYFMFISGWQREHRKLQIPAITHAGEPGSPQTGLLLDDTQDYVFWALAAKGEKFPIADLAAAGGPELQSAARTMMRGWHPDLLRLVSDSDPSTVSTVKIRSMAPVRPWPTTSITLLGDAIHNMTPMAGIGANTALRDASLLSRKLSAAARGEQELLTAIREYEAEMLDYGFAAVRQSMQRTRQATSGNAVKRAISRRMLRVVGTVPPIRRKMARKMGN